MGFSLILRAFFDFPNECQFIECQFFGKFRYHFFWMVVKEGTIFQPISKNKKFLDNAPKTIDNFAFLGYTNLKNREGWYDHDDSTERIPE